MVRVTTINVRGLRDDVKRREIFMYLKKKEFEIIMLQETHSEKEDEQIWRSQWGSDIFFSHGERNARGTATLFSKKLQHEVKKINIDNDGRIVMIDCKINDKELLITNVYAPNKDDPNFFVNMFSMMSNFNTADRIIAGDLNLVLDVKNDACNRKGNNTKSQAIVKSYMEETMMIDIWRHKNKEFQFTWFNRKDEIYARLDYVLVNYALVSNITNAEIIPAYKTDHCAVVIQICLQGDEKKRTWFLEAE